MWFEKLTGFNEQSAEQVRNNISIDGNNLKSLVNGKEYIYGLLETPSLAELRSRIQANEIDTNRTETISIREVVANVQHLHADESNAGSLFQVASQFNLLEMTSPNITPEHGIDGYEHDRTQGPACAIAAGAGTIYRNYFADVNGQKGQSVDNQIDCLVDLGVALENSNNRLWTMNNGYALATEKGLIEITNRLKASTESEKDELRQLLRIGLQWNTEVTIADSKHTVSQAYCSALPVAYSHHSSEHWSEFAQLILEASYEASFCASILNYLQNGNKKLYLTLLGGGAFGNETKWIINAIHRSLNLYRHEGLDVIIVSYGYSNESVQKLIRNFTV